MMYYHPKKQKIVAFSEIVREFNVSLPRGQQAPSLDLISQIGLVPLNMNDKPEINEYQSLVATGAVSYNKGDDFATMDWTVEESIVDEVDGDGNVIKTRETLLAEKKAREEEYEQSEQERLEAERVAAEEAAAAEHLQFMLMQRDSLLVQTDKYSLPDYPHADDATKQNWLTYRQELRNITNHVDWPNLTDDQWPVIPS